jgi:mannitol-1-/sugar-/sorbitol-6-phosphatase
MSAAMRDLWRLWVLDINLRDVVRAVLFDMDGTLVTSDAAVERAWMSWAAEYAVDGPHAIEIAHGRPSEPTVRTLLPHLDEAQTAVAIARQLELQYDDLADVTAMPGAFDLLALLDRRGLPWAVVTSADDRLAKARLGAAGIAAPTVVTSDDVPVGKPDPAGYLRAAELLGVPASDCLVVEDAEAGLQAARAAGSLTAALNGLDGDVRLASLDDLVTLLR